MAKVITSRRIPEHSPQGPAGPYFQDSSRRHPVHDGLHARYADLDEQGFNGESVTLFQPHFAGPPDPQINRTLAARHLLPDK
jgi:hypothetical protein